MVSNFSKSSQAVKHALFVAFHSFVIFLSIWGAISVGGFFKVPPSHMKVPPDHYKRPHAISKEHTPLLIPVAAMGKYKQANEYFNSTIMATLTIHKIGPIRDSRLSYLKQFLLWCNVARAVRSLHTVTNFNVVI